MQFRFVVSLPAILHPTYFDPIMPNAKAQLERAIHQIQEKGPVPEIDFTQHQLEDGNIISTQERVVKDVRWTFSHFRRDG